MVNDKKIINDRKIRTNISIAPELKEYLDKKANSMGMSSSAYISMLISQSRLQEQALDSVDLLKTMMAQMKDMGDKK